MLKRDAGRRHHIWTPSRRSGRQPLIPPCGTMLVVVALIALEGRDVMSRNSRNAPRAVDIWTRLNDASRLLASAVTINRLSK